ncbi:MAG: SCO family protein [Terriglobales bacterium]
MRTRASVLAAGPLLRLLVPIGLAGLGACTPNSAFHATDISGVMPPLEFQLTGAAGRPLSGRALAGKVTLLYFGYTSCPDVCPATLLKLGLALKHLGDDSDSVRVLFVSVDPQRDSPSVLDKYVGAFGPHIVGLSGTDQELTALTKRYRVAYRRSEPDPSGWYAVSHSSAVFVFDRNGRARLLIGPSETAAQISEDLGALLH